MKFLILSRAEAEEFKTGERHIAISAHDPNSEPANLPEETNRLTELFLEFSDINERGQLHIAKGNFDIRHKITYFDNSHAKAILDFYNEWKGKVNLTIVNCEAGICRSSAIAGALSVIEGQDDTPIWKRYLPNTLVYNAILKAHFGGGYEIVDKSQIFHQKLSVEDIFCD